MRILVLGLSCLVAACGTKEPERPSGERAMVAKAVADVDEAAAEARRSRPAQPETGTKARP